ncbi:MAG: hypothetical protein ACRCU3_04770 [Eubacteriaceae bacterium]
MCNNKKQHCHSENSEDHAHCGNDGHQHAHNKISDDHGHGHSHEHHHAHPHEHEHGHSHGGSEHCHNHGEEHKHCGCGCGEPVEKKDEEILGILLDHWVAHNQDHASEYNLWVEKMNRLGKNDVAEDLIEAIALMAEADKHLSQAKVDLIK